jgi:HEAT repeat protein
VFDPATDPRSVPTLFEAVVSADRVTASQALAALQWRGTEEVLTLAVALSQSENPAFRERSAEVLGRIGTPVRTFPDQCFAALLTLLSDDDQSVMIAAMSGLWWTDAVRATPLLIPFAQHSDSFIRREAAKRLGTSETPEAIKSVLSFLRDKVPEVREWAAFSLGQTNDVDTFEIRDALFERITDISSGVRREAIIGLCRRRDMRMVGYLKTMLHDEPDDGFVIEAAERLLGIEVPHCTTAADLLGGLQRLQRWQGKNCPEAHTVLPRAF